MKQKVTHIAAAIILEQGKILIGKRGEGKELAGFFEFPGGKQEEGEDLPFCAIRECKEELSLTIKIDKLFCETIYTYPQKTVFLHFFLAHRTEGKINDLVHSEYRWVKKEELTEYEFCPANTEVIEKLIKGDFLH